MSATKMSDLSAFNCVDCGVSTINEYYMVTHDLWKKAGMLPHGGMLCIEHLEKRIGRQLVPDDFLLCPLNQMNKEGHNWGDPVSSLLFARINGLLYKEK